MVTHKESKHIKALLQHNYFHRSEGTPSPQHPAVSFLNDLALRVK